MPGDTYLFCHRVFPFDFDEGFNNLHILPFVFVEILIGVLRIDLFDVKIHIIQHHIGASPRNIPVVSDHYARKSCKSYTSHIDVFGINMKFVPDGGGS